MAVRKKRSRRQPKRAKRRAPSRDLGGAAELARRRFGVAQLHPLQREAIEAVLEGRDVLAVLPTGYGKSLIYQLPALLAERPTIVVSPLIALMRDQERALRQANVPVVRIDSTLLVGERREALERLGAGGRLVVLTTPETLESEATREAFETAGAWLLCVDEAHCISEWGHDFRPAYLRLASARERLGDVQVLALTATATPTVREQVAERLALREPKVVAAPPHRDNLRLEVEEVSAAAKPARLGELLRKLARPAIVYCATTTATDDLGRALARTRIPSERYHGKLPKADREAAQQRFMRTKPARVMIATSAFGMGIDKRDIRTIVHYHAPGSLEQYVQESGRAGRDGEPSRCLLLYDPADLDIQRHLQRQGRASTSQLRAVSRALEAWAGEERPVSVADLALSANVPQTAARAMATQLEELGALERDTSRRLHLVVSAEELRERTGDLEKKLETRRRADEERLKALDDYASTLGCRSAFVRRYFGEEDPPSCGRCDRCAARPPKENGRRGKRKRDGRRGKKPARRRAEGENGGERKRKPRRRRRRRKKHAE